MKKVLVTLLAAAMLMTSLTACSNNTDTSPAPSQGITVNNKDFTIVDPASLSNAQKQLLDNYKTSKGYTYWQENGNFFIAIFAGEKSTSGYTINVNSIEDNEGKTNILIDVIGPKDIAASVISYPFIVVKVTGITDNFSIKDTKGDIYSALRGGK